MSGLDLGQAPRSREPWRFLRSSLLWGLMAGAWWVWQGEWALTSRWAPPTVVSVHAWVLGVLGNAMLGSLLQFLPVAATARLILPVSAAWLNRAFNLGVVTLLLFFIAPHRSLALLAVLLLAGTLGTFAVCSLLALRRVVPASALHRSIAASLWSLLTTVLLGAMAAMVLAGSLDVPLENLVNLHAAIGLGGWCAGLLAAVGAVTVPMFQGARVLATPARQAWQCFWVGSLALAVMAATTALPTYALVLGVSLPCAGLATLILWMQFHSSHPRNHPLRLAWRVGALCLWTPTLLPLLMRVLPASASWPSIELVAGTAVVVAGLPLLVIGMQLEIVPFLAWIEMRQRHPRGVRVPGVGSLLAPAHKQHVVLAHVAAALAAVLAALVPALTPAAGVLVMLAYALSLVRLHAVWRTARAFTPAPAPLSGQGARAGFSSSD